MQNNLHSQIFICIVSFILPYAGEKEKLSESGTSLLKPWNTENS
jgi:hypothetical protein